MKPSDDIKKPLKDWLADFYDDTGKISELVRNLALAGIGIIWIFKNSDLTHDILPKPLVLPLILIVVGLSFDLLQYAWRAITAYILYRRKEYQYDKRLISNNDIADVQAPNFFEVGTWIFFLAKIFFVAFSYYKIFLFLLGKM